MHGSDAMFWVMTVHGVDLLYFTSGTGLWQLCIVCGGDLHEPLLARLHISRLARYLGV